MTSLFDPIQLGDISLANRIVMAPLTRNRAAAGQVPGPLTVAYYRQRASAGLIIAEASQISPMAQGYLDTPGIHTPAQVSAWRQVTDAVHDAGGRIVIQLWLGASLLAKLHRTRTPLEGAMAFTHQALAP